MIPQKRIIAIDILKVFAVLLVLNSHMDICYEKYSYLATGGAIGDALFFFTSGFMLFRGQSIRLDHFMKRRISRIYPTVFIVAIVGGILFGRKDDIISILVSGGGWFVSCIMIYYVVIWIIKQYLKNYLSLVWGGIILIILIWFYYFFDYNEVTSIYGNTYFKWGFFFIFMLQGAIMGINPSNYPFNKLTIPKLLGCIILWYVMLFSTKHSPILIRVQWISLLPLYGVTYYTYRFCCAPFWSRFYEHHIIGQILFITGGLCLECYLIQGFLFTDKLNWLFPINIPIIMISILLISYGINFLSSAFSQTFSESTKYDWKKCFLKKVK